jgi:uncharacterized membrane protein
MAQKQLMRKCCTCEKMTLHMENNVNHILHIILTVLTFGLYLIIWFFICVFAGNRQCMECGEESRRLTLAAWIFIAFIFICVFTFVLLMY